MQTVTLPIFLLTNIMVFVRWIDSVAAAMVGVVLMVMLGSKTEEQGGGADVSPGGVSHPQASPFRGNRRDSVFSL